METNVAEQPTKENDAFTMSKETAESIATVINAAAPHIKDMQAASLEAVRSERHDAQNAQRPAYRLQMLIVGAVAVGALGAAVLGQWAITEKLFIALLGVGFGAKLAR